MFRTATKNYRRRTGRAVGQAVLNLIVQSCLVAGLAIWIVISVRSGQLAHKGGVIFRGANPKVFWSVIALLIAFVALQGLLLLGRLDDYVSVAIAPFVIRCGPNEPSDTLRRCARCSKCGHKGAAILSQTSTIA
jgi:hypothetical protein